MSPNRISILCLILFTSCSVMPRQITSISVDSDKTGLHISFQPPPGWTGGDKGVWPSYETWGFSRGVDPDDRYISIRVDRPSAEMKNGIDASLSDSDGKVAQSLKESFENPIVETVAYVPVNGKTVSFRKALNVGGAQIFGQTTIDGVPVSFELMANNGKIRSEDQKAFFAFIQSVSFNR